jgi:hypothetical protein
MQTLDRVLVVKGEENGTHVYTLNVNDRFLQASP